MSDGTASDEDLPKWQVWADPKEKEEAGTVFFWEPEAPVPEVTKPAPEPPPKDYINCLNRHPRLVAACMKVCWLPHYCGEFHKFFEKRGQTPIEYFNRDGIGAQAMRRIVFDCDRCGKRDVDPVFSRYSREGQSQEYLLSEEDRMALVEQTGYAYADVGQVIFSVLENLERQKDWLHFCDRCFGKIADSLAQIMNLPKVKTEAPAPAAEGEEAPEAEAASGRKLKKVAG